MSVTLSFLPLHEGVPVPEYKSEQAAGLDLHAWCPEGDVVLSPGRIEMIRCGFSMAIPPGYEAQVRPRSGLASRHGVTLPNAPGTIDSDYRGEVMVPLMTLLDEPFTVTHGMRIAQMVIARCERARIEVVTSLDETGRGSGGFGSTG